MARAWTAVKLHGDHSLQSSVTAGNSIYQERPSDTTWVLWRKANRLWSTKTGNLSLPLGRWTIATPLQRQHHQAYIQHEHLCEADYVLWVRMDGRYVGCTQVQGLLTYRETTSGLSHSELPPAAAPVEVWQGTDSLWHVSAYSDVIIPTRIPVPATFCDFVHSLSPWEFDLLQHMDLTRDPFSTSVMLAHGVRAVSDGSVWDNNQGAFGWTVSTDTGTRLAQGMGPARGAKVDSYRAEAYGMLATLVFLNRLAEYTTHMEPWFGILATDSQSLLETIAYTVHSPDEDIPPEYGSVKSDRES